MFLLMLVRQQRRIKKKMGGEGAEERERQRERERETDRQTDRATERQTERERDSAESRTRDLWRESRQL